MNVENNHGDSYHKLEQVLSETVKEEFGIDTNQPAAQETVRSLSMAVQHLPQTMLIGDVQRLINRTLLSDGDGGVLHNDEFNRLSQSDKVRRLQTTSNIVGALADVLAQLD